jgi:hypothetical protein
MRVTFERLADHVWGHVLIERDDGVVYRMHAGPITAEIPHDLVHFTVEESLGIADGIWGAIAGGIVFRSMTHVSGRRPPHVTERSDELKRAYRDRLQRAELLGGLVESAAHRPDADLAGMARTTLTAIGPDAPGLAAVAGAVTALRRAEERWRTLPIGTRLVLDWPAHRRIAPVGSRQRRDRGRGRTRSSRAG